MRHLHRILYLVAMTYSRILLVAIGLLSGRVDLLAQSDVVVDRNGTVIGDRKELMAECIKGLREDKANAMMDHERACTCFLGLMNGLDASELDMEQSDGQQWLASKMAKDSTMALSLIECFAGSLRTDVPIGKFGKEVLERMIEECRVGMEASPETVAMGVDGQGTCRCVFEESQRKGLTLADINEMADESSVHFNEIMVPCLQRNMGNTGGGRRVGSPDVSGKKNTDEVPLMNTGNIFKVKIRIGGGERYFILDSGASDCMIPASLEKDLLARQAILPEKYLEPGPYTLADGRTVSCRRFVMGSLGIGEFTVKNVVIAVIDEEATFLLGKSFLDKFEEWTVDPRASTLYLKKQ